MRLKGLLVFVLTFVFCFDGMSWGRLGHSTIQEIAWRHLTPTAKANIQKYVGETIPPEYSWWLDSVVGTSPYNVEFAGWHASIATPDCKSPLYIRNLKRSCKDGVTASYMIRDYLQDYKELPDSSVVIAIKCLIHAIGDFHCPAHVRFTDDGNAGKFPVEFDGTQTTLHTVWDSRLVQHESCLGGSDCVEYANRLDTWSRSRIKAVQKGWTREWFEDVARDVRPIVGKVKSGDVLTQDWMKENYPLAELEIRKAGYRLAAALNEIFGK